jgi:hypothetical protein
MKKARHEGQTDGNCTAKLRLDNGGKRSSRVLEQPSECPEKEATDCPHSIHECNRHVRTSLGIVTLEVESGQEKNWNSY